METVQGLLEVLGNTASKTAEAIASTHKSRMVAFEDIWHLFDASLLVVTAIHGVEAVCRVKDCTR